MACALDTPLGVDHVGGAPDPADVHICPDVPASGVLPTPIEPLL
jgi:hypothetical protein